MIFIFTFIILASVSVTSIASRSFFLHVCLFVVCFAPFIGTEAKVLGVVEDETQGPAVILDKTIFHPQGGGQPSDEGR